MTYSEARRQAATLGVSINRTGYDKEMIVRVKGSPADHGYFTDDPQDALDTAKAMVAKHVDETSHYRAY